MHTLRTGAARQVPPWTVVALILIGGLVGLHPTTAAAAQATRDFSTTYEDHTRISFDDDQHVIIEAVSATKVAEAAAAFGYTEAEYIGADCPTAHDAEAATDALPGVTVELIKTETYCGISLQTPPLPIAEVAAELEELGDTASYAGSLSAITSHAGTTVESIGLRGDQQAFIALSAFVAEAENFYESQLVTSTTTLSVAFPGPISAAPGAQIEKNTATWNLQSSTGYPGASGSLSPSTPWPLISGIAAGSLGLIVAGIVLLVLRRRNRALTVPPPPPHHVTAPPPPPRPPERFAGPPPPPPGGPPTNSAGGLNDVT